MDGSMTSLVEPLTALGLASGVARSSAVYALVSASHILGVALLVGPILLVDLRLLGLLSSLDDGAIRTLRRAAMLGVVLALSAGALLLSAKPADYAANRVVWAKLAVVAAGLANALAFEWRVRRSGIDAMLAGAGRRFAAISIMAWLAALLLGRWIAFA
jgi:hypothetical protein